MKRKWPPCADCGGHADGRIPQRPLCARCRRRRHYHPQDCPGCGQRRPLGYPADGDIVCAGCAKLPSAFACADCGREEHPYGSRRCARCLLTERLIALLTDPSTGQVHARLKPLFDEMVTSERPQTGIWWLRKGSRGPDLLGQMARGEIEIGHDALRTRPGRESDYLRNLLVAVGVLGTWEPHIERFTVWLEAEILPALPRARADVIRQYGRWHVLRNLRERARHGQLTQMLANSARIRIRAAVEFLDLLADHDAIIQTATQAHLEHFLVRPGYNRTAAIAGFVAWLRKTRINTDLTVPWTGRSAPPITVSDDQRWNDVERLLHDDTIRRHARIGGLLTLLFAQPLVRIVAMRTDQVELAHDAVHVTFADTPIQMPPLLDDLLREHTTRRGQSLYASRDTGWLFPGGQPGLHLATENIRRDLVAVGIKPYENRKAALFQLAANMPAPILAELLGTTNANAAAWAKLAARDWSAYIQHRATIR